MAARMVVAVTPFAAMVKGVEVLVRPGDQYPARSLLVKGREHLFKPVDGTGNKEERPDATPSARKGASPPHEQA